MGDSRDSTFFQLQRVCNSVKNGVVTVKDRSRNWQDGCLYRGQDSWKQEEDHQRIGGDSALKIEILLTPKSTEALQCWNFVQNPSVVRSHLSKSGSAHSPKPWVSPLKRTKFGIVWAVSHSTPHYPHWGWSSSSKCEINAPCFSIIPGWFAFSNYK